MRHNYANNYVESNATIMQRIYDDFQTRHNKNIKFIG